MNTENTTTTTEAVVIGRTILAQAESGVFMSLGAHQFATGDMSGYGVNAPGVTMLTRILPMTARGTRGTNPRNMRLTITLNGRDLYDIAATYPRRGDRFGIHPPVVHYAATDVHVADLNRHLLALDYDGDEVLDPRYA